MKTSEIIEKAQIFLWDGRDGRELDWDYKIRASLKEQFICHAIQRAVRNGTMAGYAEPSALRKLTQVISMIESRIAPSCTLCGWLIKKHGIPEKELTHVRVQKHRKQWMKKLIKEFKAKGD